MLSFGGVCAENAAPNAPAAPDAPAAPADPATPAAADGAKPAGADATKADGGAITKNDSLSEFKDAEAGYSFKVPAGYTRLTQDQIRTAFKGLSNTLGKSVSERTLLRPPAYFQGPIDPAHPKELPPGLAIGFTALAEPVDPALMNQYKNAYEADLRKNGDSTGDVQVDVISVNGVPSLRIEHDIFSPIDNTRMRMVKISVPGHERRYDVVFSFYSDQADSVKDAISTVTKSFAVTDTGSWTGLSSRWVRVALYTLGGLVLGLLIGVVFSAMAGSKQPQASAATAKKT